MSLESITALFGWSAIINYTILLIWFIIFSLAHEAIYNLHKKLFNISKAKFDSYHYLSMAVFKIIIIVFNITPYLVLKFTV